MKSKFRKKTANSNRYYNSNQAMNPNFVKSSIGTIILIKLWTQKKYNRYLFLFLRFLICFEIIYFENFSVWSALTRFSHHMPLLNGVAKWGPKSVRAQTLRTVIGIRVAPVPAIRCMPRIVVADICKIGFFWKNS